MSVIHGEHTRPPGDGPRLLMVGPQGAGKGTQGVRIATAFGVPIVSTGDLFREHVAHRTHLGVQVKTFIDSGRLVPDELTGLMVRQRIDEPSSDRGFLLDGYPRNIHQALYLDQVLEEKAESLDAVIALDVAARRVNLPSAPESRPVAPHRRHRNCHRQALGHLRS